MEAVLAQIVEAINAHAQPRPFDYVMLFLTAFSIGVSACAVVYAVKVPKKIAEQQNKIALFEKRFEVYKQFKSVKKSAETVVSTIVCSGGIAKNNESEDATMAFAHWVGMKKTFGSNKDIPDIIITKGEDGVIVFAMKSENQVHLAVQHELNAESSALEQIPFIYSDISLDEECRLGELNSAYISLITCLNTYYTTGKLTDFSQKKAVLVEIIEKKEIESIKIKMESQLKLQGDKT